MSIIERLEPGFYAKSREGEFYKVDLPVKMKPVVYYNLQTGKKHYPTNGDMIRHMTDEELSVWLAGRTDCAGCPYCGDDCEAWTCDEAWLKWLQQEAPDG